MTEKGYLLKGLAPDYLPSKYLTNSQVWQQHIELKSDSLYQFLAISGKGKTTLLNILFGSLSAYKGQVEIAGTTLQTANKKKISELRQQIISYVPQGLNLFNDLTVMENIQLKNKLTKHKTSDEIKAMLESLGMAEHLKKTAQQISFGQKQRIAIIRALCQPFQFLLLDEPFSHLDNDMAEMAWQLIESERQKQKASVILTAHHKMTIPDFNYYEI